MGLPSACRSAVHWDVASQTSEVTLSQDLAPPLTVFQASVTIPPLPYPASASTLAPQPQQVPLMPDGTPQGMHSHQEMPSQTEPKQGLKSRLLPWAPKLQQPQSQQKQRQAASTEHSGRDGLMQTGSAQQHAASDPHSTDQGQKADTMQGSQPRRQQQDKTWAGSTKAAEQSGRWFAPPSMRWPVQSKQTAKLRLHIKVLGSAHGMPIIGQLQVLGLLWCKAKLVRDSSTTDSARSPSESISAAAAQVGSFASRLYPRFLWKNAEQPQSSAVRPDAMLVEADVPVHVLQMLVSRLEEQHTVNADSDGGGEQPAQAHSEGQQAQLLSLRLQTDFVTLQHPVQASLPVVWVLGPDAARCQAIWRTLTRVEDSVEQGLKLKSGNNASEELGDVSQPFSQRLKQRLGHLKLLGRDSAGQQSPMPTVCACRAGVQYVNVSLADVPFPALLSCVSFVMLQMFQQGAQQKFVSLASRMRAVYHRQQLQQLQQSLHHQGLLTAVVLAIDSTFDDKAAGELHEFVQQMLQNKVAVVGVANGLADETDSLSSIGVQQWVTLPAGVEAMLNDHDVGLRQRLHAAMYLQMRSPLTAKL